MTDLRENLVEVIAKAVYGRFHRLTAFGNTDRPWEDLREDSREKFREEALEIFQAILSLLPEPLTDEERKATIWALTWMLIHTEQQHGFVGMKDTHIPSWESARRKLEGRTDGE